ncbi:MAG TPA: ABC transporter transmembrane domain-containing protein, partial [Tabrizicola sp.]|nr:ABC transporter transmembrane domain-containing protein [Tabrizicola sp.]
MNRDRNSAGAQELKSARRESSGLVVAAVLFSIAVNALMLTGPLYMLQVYDRVLGSGSEATLLALSVLVVGLFAAMGVLEYARGRVMAIVGARFQDRLDRRVFAAAMQRSALNPTDATAMIAQRDLEAVRTFLAAPVLLAILDLPWTPLFVLAIFVFHPLLGWLAVGGGLFLICVTAVNQVASRRPQKEAVLATVQSERMSDQMKGEAETLQALGMTGAGFDRWQEARQLALQKGIAAAGLAGGLGALTKTFRLFLQSAMLGFGAWLVLRHELTAGAMIVASTLLGRGLAPIEMVVGQWAVVQRAHEAWHRLSELLSRTPQPAPRTALPRPRALLEVEGLTV